MPAKQPTPHWTEQRFTQPEQRIGEFHPALERFTELFNEAAALKNVLGSRNKGRELVHDAALYRHFKQGEKRDRASYNLAISRRDTKQGTAPFEIAIDDRAIKGHDVYHMTTSGVITSADRQEVVDKEHESYELVTEAIKKLTSSLQDKISSERNDRIWARQERNKRIAKASAAIGAVLLVGGSLYAGIKTWAIDPAERAEAARQAYDANEPRLPGEPVELDVHRLNTMPAGEFDDIPTYGGSDTNLNSPRMFETAFGEECFMLPNTYDTDTELIVTAPADSFYDSFHYSTGISPSGDVSVCVIEEVIRDHAVKLAVQTVE